MTLPGWYTPERPFAVFIKRHRDDAWWKFGCFESLKSARRAATEFHQGAEKRVITVNLKTGEEVTA